MRLERQSPCKVNLLLNILGKRSDGFHELETVMQPVPLCDMLSFERIAGSAVELTCSDRSLACDESNLVVRAALRFFEATGIRDRVRIYLEKRIPLAAGLGGGSSNAAITLLALNELFDAPLAMEQLRAIAASLGSDVPFFLQPAPALATGRGEQIAPLPPFAALQNKVLLLIHPGFGISTAWAYQNLARFPEALNGRPGRALELVRSLQAADLPSAAQAFYNSLEAPAFDKFPILELYQQFLRENGALATLMSGSGSTTFALFANPDAALAATEKFRQHFGTAAWMVHVPIRE